MVTPSGYDSLMNYDALMNYDNGAPTAVGNPNCGAAQQN
jgi:hypothetical protein